MTPAFSSSLTESDLVLLSNCVGVNVDELTEELKARPWHLHDVLSDSTTVKAVLEAKGLDAAIVSPFLFFAVAAYHCADDLMDTDWIADWMGPQVRLPVFDVAPIQDFTGDRQRLLYLAHLLASFVAPTVSSGLPVGPLDLGGLVIWLDAVNVSDQNRLLRRLGDTALFLAGVCADNTGAQVLNSVQASRLAPSVGMTGQEVLEMIDPASLSPGLDTLESLGMKWYSAAVDDLPNEISATVFDISRHFRPARRFLNYMADNYINPGGDEIAMAV